ncbi:hypothetical protein MTR67_018767 [Solanum verrucosum]|uniref:Uncharacterized protein n=1 Tax=Solanum verrucosum TaxID=315347 RepID=A0AAF0QMD4_SOLVR|nr:hypothetical protein MTR67_018767 [Solanum verrucosum]
MSLMMDRKLLTPVMLRSQI